MQVIYYTCYKCGYHTSSTELRLRCPNCHVNEKYWTLVGKVGDVDLQEKISEFIDKMNNPKQ